MTTQKVTADALQDVPRKEWKGIVNIVYADRPKSTTAQKLRFDNARDAEDVTTALRAENILCLYDKAFKPTEICVMKGDMVEVDKTISALYIPHEEV